MWQRLIAGTVAGLAGTWVLDRVDWFNWNNERPVTRIRTRLARPGGRDPAHELVHRIATPLGLDAGDPADNAAGHVAHYTIGVSGGLGFALARPYMAFLGPLRGVVFGAGIWLLQDEGLNTIAGLSADPRDYPWQDHTRGLIAHVAFGVAADVVLGLLDRGSADAA